MAIEKSYTDSVDELSKELGVEFSIALDIWYLRNLERRIIEAAKLDTSLRNFPVYNQRLENWFDTKGIK